MACQITGRIIRILKPEGGIENAPCNKYPCKAIVRIINISDCGSSMTVLKKDNKKVKMTFGFSLVDTKKSFPSMKEHYPGLKKGNIFTATVEERIMPNGKNQFIIYHYSKK